MTLTRTGYGVLGASVVLYLAGWLLGYPEPAVIAVAGALAVALATVWVLPHPRLTVSREVLPRKVSRGRPAEGVMTVDNAGRALRSGLLTTDSCAGIDVPVALPALASGERRVVRYPLPTMRRGLVPVGPLRLVRADLFALARRVIAFGEAETLLVRPATVELGAYPAGRAHSLDGPTSDAATAGTGAFHSLRDYVLGDDLRRVHWPSTARTGTLMIRQLVDVSLPQTSVVLDLRIASYRAAPPSDGSDPRVAEDWFELAVDAAASVALAAGRLNFPVDVRTTTGSLLETRGGRQDAGELLDRLALVEASTDGSMADALDEVRRSRAAGVLVVVTGAGADRSEAGLVSVAGSRFDRVVLIRVGPRTLAMEPLGAGPPQIAVHDPDSLIAGWQRAAAP